MKYAKYGLVFSFVLGALGIVGSFKVPKSFGKTHFIVGYPHQTDSSSRAKLDTVSSTFSDNVRITNKAQSVGSTQTGGVRSVLFAPDDNVQQELIKLIEHETGSIKMAIFMLTSKPITDALCAAHARGVKIIIITDNMCARERWSKIHQLTKAGIVVYEYMPSATQSRANDLMHHKFVIFSNNINNKALVWTGSFNFTQSAQVRNQENAIVLSDTEVVEKFSTQFKRLKKRSKRLT